MQNMKESVGSEESELHGILEKDSIKESALCRKLSSFAIGNIRSRIRDNN